MSNQNSYFNSPRENFLMSLLSKVINEYKNLLEYVRSKKPLRIIEIETLSSIPNLLSHMHINDIYDIGYTHGSESILKERAALLLAKHIY